MENLKALEVTGTIDEHGQLRLDTLLPITGPSRTRVIILLPDDTDPDEREWLHAATTNPVFHFLQDASEDIYTVTDGKPFQHEG
ncbi:MAG: hypothetical protein M1546_25020 [Chloroflexi bacterium]|nr:hypothetical protein [Chloroflexota bacterium]